MTGAKYWFPAKRYGWGWGLPITWQGWVVFVAYLVLLFGSIPFIEPESNTGLFVLYTVAISSVLVGLCWLKGEPPRWRWGGDA